MAKTDPFAPSFKAIAAVRTEDSAVNRAQDQILQALNTRLREVVLAAGVVPRVDSASLPKADAVYAGRLVRVKDAGSREVLKACMETTTGAWEWTTVAATST